MVNDVHNVLRSCERCLTYKRFQKTEDALMVLHEPTNGPWERVDRDLVGSFSLLRNCTTYFVILLLSIAILDT